jgi:hypothetical protein
MINVPGSFRNYPKEQGALALKKNGAIIRFKGAEKLI